METTLSARTATAGSAASPEVSSLDGILPPDVLALIDDTSAQVSKPKSDGAAPLKRLLPRLLGLWSEQAGFLLRDQMLHGKVRKKQLAKEIGYRLRIRAYTPANEARQALGDQEFRIDQTVSDMADENGETFIVPSAQDRGLVGSPAYPGGNHFNPYLWVPLINQHTKEGGVIWELGPGWVSSASEVGHRLKRDVVLVVPPAADKKLRLRIDPISAICTKHSGRPVFNKPADGKPAEPGLGDLQPDLVLVPLPVPVDAWAVTDCIRAWTHGPKGRGEWAEAGLEMWAYPVGDFFMVEEDEISPLEVEHPEFATNIDRYLTATVSRLSSLQGVVAAGGSAKVAVVAPMVRGLPRAVEQAIKRAFPAWKLIQQRYAFEEGGKRHRGNGTPLVGDAITIWTGGR